MNNRRVARWSPRPHQTRNFDDASRLFATFRFTTFYASRWLRSPAQHSLHRGEPWSLKSQLEKEADHSPSRTPPPSSRSLLCPRLNAPEFGHQRRRVLVFLERHDLAVPHGENVRPSHVEHLA